MTSSRRSRGTALNGCEDTARLDVWLWRARWFKTRGDAATAASKGRIRVLRPGRHVTGAKPSFLVTPGDVITLRKTGQVQTVRVLACGTRRGPASEARMLYDLVEADAASDAGPGVDSGVEQFRPNGPPPFDTGA